MDGITDMPFRGLCRRLGSAMTVTEFINALDVFEGNPRYHRRLAFEPYQRPLSLQILGDKPERMLAATERLVDRVHPDIIDVNIGCQSKNVTARGAGAALMKTPEKIARIFQLMTDRFDIPITGKIRLGWDKDHLNYLEVAKIIEDSGGAMVAVHGRTRKQAYRGKADWEPIREVKDALSIPVVGNGDVQNTADIEAIKQSTGCDAVMIGRAAVGNPWIFSRLDREEVPDQIVKETIFNHLDAMVDFYGERGVITFRKFLKAYLKPYDLPQETLLLLLKSKDADFIKSNLEKFFA
jgi:nifR3 family TIM-barrel protein